MPRKTANIWKIGLYRRTENKDEAECILCAENGEKKTTVATKDWTTTGLVQHLKTRHSETEYFTKFQKSDQTQPDNNQETANLDKFIHITSGGELSYLDKKVINFVCSNLVSFKLLDNPATISLLSHTNEKLKGESYYRKTVLPKAYQALKSKMLNELRAMEALSFTTDIWSGPNDSYISLTAHGINKEWKARNFVLCVRVPWIAHRRASGRTRSRKLLIVLTKLLIVLSIQFLVTTTASQEELQHEITVYCAQPREKVKTDPLEYWKNATYNFPNLAKGARRYLSATATSVASEGLFSTARDVFTYKRMSLRPRKAEMIIFLQRNLPLYNYKY